MPDEVFAERGILPDVKSALESRGHIVTMREPWGSANSILVAPDGLYGAADPRTRGSLAVGN
jgi:gamma-glutamyltranspeptidase/glutathione hydrolase